MALDEFRHNTTAFLELSAIQVNTGLLVHDQASTVLISESISGDEYGSSGFHT